MEDPEFLNTYGGSVFLLSLFWSVVGLAALGHADLLLLAYGPRWYFRWRGRPASIGDRAE